MEAGMVVVNDLPGFIQASDVRNGAAQVVVAGEIVWLRNCRSVRIGEKDGFQGDVCNVLESTRFHGLSLGDTVVFFPTPKDDFFGCFE